MDNRREFLKKSVLLSGAAAFSGSLPASIQRALAIDPAKGSTYLEAEHVVILMQENRSFDHCFGTLRGVRGFNDPRAIDLPNKNRVWLQTNQAGETYAPFHFDIKDTKATWMGAVPHSRPTQVDAFNNGRYDKWLDAKKIGDKRYAGMPLTMGYYTRDDIPFNYALADAFTVCDQNFCSAMTSTWPNRLYLWGGTIREEKNEHSKAYIRNEIPYGEARWKTFPERLSENNVSWKVYQNELASGGGYSGEERAWLANFGCNPLEFLAQFNSRFSPRYVQGLQRRAAALPAQIAELQQKLNAMKAGDKGYNKLQKEIDTKKKVLADTQDQLAKWSKESFEKLTDAQKDLYRRAFTTNAGDPDYLSLTTLTYEEDGVQREMMVPKGDVLYQFRKDVDSGELPTVSWIVPSQNLSDHPSAPWYGAWFTSEILDTLTRNPDVWKKTIFILTYDENDGYFDHVPPFVAPDPKDANTGKCSSSIKVTGEEYTRRETEIVQGVPQKQARGGPIGLGFRVPMVIASPWSRGGKVCSQVFDHTSPLQFLENFLSNKFGKNIREENISSWRRAICGDLTAAFTTYQGDEKNDLPFLKRDPFMEKIYNARFKDTPSNFKKLSAAEIAAMNRDPSLLPCRQEPGMRTATAIPYQLYADGMLDKPAAEFAINLVADKKAFGDKAAGAPFIIYAPGEYASVESEQKISPAFEPLRVWQFAVAAGDSLGWSWPLHAFKDKQYHLRVYGPNGFYREYMGDEKDPALSVQCDYEQNGLLKKELTGNVELKVKNAAGQSYEITVADNSYKNPPVIKSIAAAKELSLILPLAKTQGWYDFTITVKGNSTFKKRFAGRVETGKPTCSDPAMAGV